MTLLAEKPNYIVPYQKATKGMADVFGSHFTEDPVGNNININKKKLKTL